MNIRIIATAFGLFLVAIVFQNFSKVDFRTFHLKAAVDISDAICDPFSSQKAEYPEENSGLVGQLRYLVEGEHGATQQELNSRNLSYYFANAELVNAVVFMNSLNVQQSVFTNGFILGDGDVLTHEYSDKKVLEHFALFMDTTLQLGEEDGEGLYQLALLSDDGAALYLSYDEEQPDQLLIDNDGAHSSRLKCSGESIEFTANTAIPVNLQYFQSAQNQMALQLFWRQVDQNDSLEDPLCNKSGGNLFYKNYMKNGGPVPTKAYLDFIDRGWHPLEPDNFRLPSPVKKNPCFKKHID